MSTVKLHSLRRGQRGVVAGIHSLGDDDRIARRLQELGFVDGEPVLLQARGPFGREPILVQIGFTRFALRFAEADRVQVALDSGESQGRAA